MTSIFEYDNYREFLKSTYNDMRRTRAQFSLSAFARFLGFSSVNYAKLIMDGKRDLTEETLLKIAEVLNFTRKETDYFYSLVHLNQAKSPTVKRFHLERREALKKIKPISTSRLSLQKFFEQTYAPFVLMAIDRHPKTEAIQRVRDIVGLPDEIIHSLIEIMLKEQLITDKEGMMTLSSSHQIFHDSKARSLKHKKFLKAQIDISKSAIDATYEKGGKFYSHTFTVSGQDWEFYQNRIRELLSEFTRRSDETDSEKVAQMNIQFFEVSPALLKHTHS